MSSEKSRKVLKYSTGMLAGNKEHSVVSGISQKQDPYKDLPDYKPKRLTLQWLNACNLECPGCYAKPDLAHGHAIDTNDRRPVSRRTNSAALFEEHTAAHGTHVHQVYILGLEPTFVPKQTKELFEQARKIGLSAITATNGANPIKNYEASYRDAIERGQMHRVNISIDDAIDSEVNDRLRGKIGAQSATLDTIRHAVEQGDPIQITMTVWAENYQNILDSIKKLHGMGVRAFKLHEGSLEGAPDFQQVGANRVDPLSWRALISHVHQLRESLKQDGGLDNLVIPTIYYTEQELAAGYIGDAELTQEYVLQQQILEMKLESHMPFIGCPTVNVDQTYLFGNDGKYGAGAVGLCSIHTVGDAVYLADYDPDQKKFVTEKDPNRNQIARIQSSKNMCPAFAAASRDEALIRGESLSDRHKTLTGDLYHGCRLVSSNHLETDMTYGQEYFGDALNYSSFLRNRNNWSMNVQILRVHKSDLPYSEKIAAIKEIDQVPSRAVIWMSPAA